MIIVTGRKETRKCYNNTLKEGCCRLLLKLSLQLYLVCNKSQPPNEKGLERVFCAVRVVGGLEESLPLLDQLQQIMGGENAIISGAKDK